MGARPYPNEAGGGPTWGWEGLICLGVVARGGWPSVHRSEPAADDSERALGVGVSRSLP